MVKKKRNVAILGAAGRDYHNFLVYYKDNPLYDVKFFTAAQIPGIEHRKFPKALAGRLYSRDIPTFPEAQLPHLIKKYKIDEAVYSYSDLSHESVMHKASTVHAAGASFVLLGPNDTMLTSRKKVIAVTAVRTGSGKSQTTRRIAQILKKAGKRVVAVRHPMPYGDLLKERVQRFASYSDLAKNNCTIEEREEYEPWIELGITIYAGVDYAAILQEAEKEGDIILWDGGNNDMSFYRPDLYITVADPLRPGHEIHYHPGESNLRLADVVVINKIDTATKEGIAEVVEHIKEVNPKALIVKAASDLIVPGGKYLKGKRALVIEDGPTLTHGEMSFGAGYVAAKRYGATIVSPKPYAVGSIKATYEKYRQVTDVLPAMGYSVKQIEELRKTIDRVPCDIIIDASPVALGKLIKLRKPMVSVEYVLHEKGLQLETILKQRKFI